jgi:glycosyltransferase involved in cell wall biosynthesis
VITVNEPIKRIFQSRAIPNKPITVVMNTVSASTVRDSIKRPHKGFNCVYHGTLTDIYGLDIAIEGFARTSRKYKDIVFHIFGYGPSLSHLERLTKDRHLEQSVIFYGMVPYDRMIDALMEMDLGILATRRDVFLNLSFSAKLAEYVYLKIPVISSDLDTIKYYLDDENLLFFKAGDAHDLSSKIEFAYLNREQMRIKAETAYKTFQAFDWNEMAKRYIEILERDEMATCGEIK